MNDDVLTLLAELRDDVPLPGDSVMEAVYARVVTPRRARPRGRIVLAGVAVALVCSAAAFAAVREAPWWQSGTPAVDPQAVVSVARDNMPANVHVDEARTVVQLGDAALIAVPLDRTGYCVIPTVNNRATFGASCVFQVTHPAQGDDDSFRTGSASGVSIAYGRVTDPRAAKLDLGPFDVQLATGGFFLASFPEKLGGTANPGAILDAQGHVLRRGCVNWNGTPLWIDDPSGPCKPQTLPPPPTLDLSQAKTLFDVTLSQPYSIWDAGQQIAFEAVPASDGTTCVIADGPGLPSDAPSDGCAGTRIDHGQPPIDAGIGAGLAHADGKAFYSWDISGSTDPAAHIVKLTLTSPTASTDVAYAGNFFFAQLPVTTPGPVVGNVPFPDGPWTITGYDASGHQVATVDLNELERKATPR
jgi:hypothetical protein